MISTLSGFIEVVLLVVAWLVASVWFFSSRAQQSWKLHASLSLGALLVAFLSYGWLQTTLPGDHFAFLKPALIAAALAGMADLAILVWIRFASAKTLQTDMVQLSVRATPWILFLAYLMVRIDPSFTAISVILALIVLLISSVTAPLVIGGIQSSRLARSLGYQIGDWVLVRGLAYKISALGFIRWTFQFPNRETMSLATSIIRRLHEDSLLLGPYVLVEASYSLANEDDLELAANGLQTVLVRVPNIQLAKNLGVVALDDAVASVRISMSALSPASTAAEALTHLRAGANAALNHLQIDLIDPKSRVLH